MADTTEQRYALKFMNKEGETPANAYARLKVVYGHHCMSRTQAFQTLCRTLYRTQAYSNLVSRWQKCIAGDGDYVEK